MRMIKNPLERNNQLGKASSRQDDLTSPEWIARFRQFFNTSSEIFQAGTRRYGGFVAKSENPTFVHHSGIYSEFEVDEEGVAMSSGLLRRWDFTKAETRFQTEEGRTSIVGREKAVIAWLDDRNTDTGSRLIKPRVDDQERGVAYWEVFERRRRLRRMSEFCKTDLAGATHAERVELARQVLASAKALHDLNVAHLNIGPHSIWIEPPTTVKFSHLMTASFPEVNTLGESRFQFLSAVSAPEDVLEHRGNPQQKDVFLLGCVVHQLIFGKPAEGEPPEWKASVDDGREFDHLHAWFDRALDMDCAARFDNATVMLDAFNAATAGVSSVRTTIEGLERFRSVKSQRVIFQIYPEKELVSENDRVVIWKTDTSDGPSIAKLWKIEAIGDISREGSRVLAFLEGVQALIESPIPGSATFRKAHWTGDAIVVVQDLIPGKTLSEATESKALFSDPPALIRFLIALIDVVDVHHQRSMAHGDIKPDNIILSLVPDSSELSPVLIDLLDFSPSSDGERLSPAYAPLSGGRFERDRFAVAKIAEELIAGAPLLTSVSLGIAAAIQMCRSGPPANATLLPLREALARALMPEEIEASTTITIGLLGADLGVMLPDEGKYWISRFGPTVSIRGATEKLELRLDDNGRPTFGKRSSVSQATIQRGKKFELASFTGEISFVAGPTDLSEAADLLIRPEISAAFKEGITRGSSEHEGEITSDRDAQATEELEDAIEEKLDATAAQAAHFSVRQLWEHIVRVESELKPEALCLGESSFRKDARRHVVPIQMTASDYDFDRNDVVTVEKLDARGDWIRVGLLDLALSNKDFIAIESGMGPTRHALLLEGSRVRFQSRYENTSIERREAATSRILKGASVRAGIADIFQPDSGCRPHRKGISIDEAALVRYQLNPVQQQAFKEIVDLRPLGLLQGPPGTGKTRFIGALVHYALTHGLARNVLLASQSHEAVNNAAEAVLDLFGSDRDSLSLIRVGHEDSVSDKLSPYHAGRVEKAYKDRFLATRSSRLAVAARAVGLDSDVAERVLWFEEAVQPVLARISHAATDQAGDVARQRSLYDTVEHLLASRGLRIELQEIAPDEVQDLVTSFFLSSFPTEHASAIEKYRHVIELTRDIIGTVSTWERSFETFLAGTRRVVAGTCVGLGRTSLGLTKTEFDLVIVDEAARCTASELAVPMQAGKWIVLVGDHAQLEPQHSPDVVECVSENLGISMQEVKKSDFERVFDSPYGQQAGSTLTTQYRMLPPIGRIVSGAFYTSALENGRDTPLIESTALPAQLAVPLTWITTDAYGRAAFQRTPKGSRGSLINEYEADVIIDQLKRWAAHPPFVEWLSAQHPDKQSIGVICAYAAQRDLVWKKVQAENLPQAMRRALKVDTIDSYQGKENVIVLLSLVRNNDDGPTVAGKATIAPGFMARKNRINVAISRAMDRLVIVGALHGWRKDSPLGKVTDAFFAEVGRGDATELDASQLLAQALSSAKTSKNAKAKSNLKKEEPETTR
ncbi:MULTISPECIES: AAA domain-containing protein [unclassified Caballeronia]|uniref:AAA domain-containing protein n=1 Tax=unclassified Caballeronia TaxID=2646786 RepID=UPI00202908EE|nr:MULTISPECIES: AAA domain-containing protein [unclassified Caballeronia]